MQGDARVIEFLNEQLTARADRDQPVLPAREDAGELGLHQARRVHPARVDRRDEHAEVLTDRILFLEGLPNYQRLFPLRIGETVTEMFECDMRSRSRRVDRLRRGIEYMRSVGDITSARTLRGRSSPTRSTTSTTSRRSSALIEQLGEPLYLQNVTEHPEAS